MGRFFVGIRACKVAVDGPGQHPLPGRYRVRISIVVPDSKIDVDRHTAADVPAAIRESFDAADQRLEDLARIVRESSKTAKRRLSRKMAARADVS
jgi:hypothetical protein